MVRNARIMAKRKDHVLIVAGRVFVNHHALELASTKQVVKTVEAHLCVEKIVQMLGVSRVAASFALALVCVARSVPTQEN